MDLDGNDYYFGFARGERGLNQNRLNVSLGHKLTPLSNFSIGMLWQHRPNSDFWRLLLGYAHNFDLRD